MKTLPTGKSHVSFSEIKNWHECPFRHKLIYVDKLDVSEPSPYLDYGQSAHNFCEAFLTGKDPVESLVKSEEMLRKFWKDHNFSEEAWTIQNGDITMKIDPLEKWVSALHDVAAEMPLFLKGTFQDDYEVLAAEHALMESAFPESEYNFKGFIDCVISGTTGAKRKSKKVWILDWKTTNAGGWSPQKMRDPMVQTQLALYKMYWARKMSIDPKDVRCGFILLKRGAKRGKVCKLIDVSVGPKFLEKAQKLVKDALFGIENGLKVKNRNSCTWCQFRDTPHCPS